MTIEDQIQALLAKAEPLRCLPDLEGEQMGLPALVDQINALRAKQAMAEPVPVAPTAVEGEDAKPDAPEPPFKRGPGRPKKAAD